MNPSKNKPARSGEQAGDAPRRRRLHPRARRWAFAGAAVLVGLLAAMLLLEIVMRVADVRPMRFRPPRWLALRDGEYVDLGSSGEGRIKRASEFAAQGIRMGEWVPGAECKLAYDSNPRGYFDEDNAVPFRFNALGMRGPEAAEQKPPGTVRILGLGDSFTLGEGVREEDTYLRRLEATLNAAAAGRYEVLNAGVSGYNTYDEVLVLDRRWLEMGLEPDAVLIGFYLNDAYDDQALANHGQALGIYLAPDGWAEYSFLADYVQHAWRARAYRNDLEAFYRQPFFASAHRYRFDEGRQLDWPACQGALGRAAELARERGFSLGLVIFPELYKLNADYPFASVHRLVGQTCERLGIPVLDLLDAYRDCGMSESDLWVHPSDHHPNEVGHRIAAEAIEPFVRQRLLPAIRNAVD